MDMADTVAKNGTCDRKRVGAVIARGAHHVSTGYNGSIPKAPHCDEVGHLMVEGHCVRTTHAEANAIITAARFGHATEGCTIYTTASPCWTCFKLIVGAGIKRIVFKELYRDENIFPNAKNANIELVFLRTCCPWHRKYPGPEYPRARFGFQKPDECRCLNCPSCELEQMGCGCDGSMDDGCFNCTPDKHTRPACPPERLNGTATEKT